MGEFASVLKAVFGSLPVLWLAGLAFSFRLIVPARTFLSDRSAEWVAERMIRGSGAGLRRRFGVSFKRYMNRVFGARARRIRGCRVWVLGFWRCALVSVVSYLAIFGALLALTDADLLRAGFAADLTRVVEDFDLAERFGEVGGPGFVAFVFYLQLGLSAVMYGLVNTLPDYLSFVQTRNVLARMGRGVWSDLWLILLDVLMTIPLAVLGMALVSAVGKGALALVTGDPFDPLTAYGDSVLEVVGTVLGYAWSATPTGMVLMAQRGTEAMVLSAFATSLWIWVFFT
ncbi:MAG: hypothetical protein AAFQ51_18535, partial [Pseudomonadota bacterium]